MAHIQITAGPDVRATGCVLVDGVDITDHIVAEGFAINAPRHPSGVWSVTMTIVAETLDVDLPDAILDVDRVSPPRRLCEMENGL